MTAEADVLAAASRRAEALVAGDAQALTALLHPALRWTNFRGELLDREQYVAGNTNGSLLWRAQILRNASVAVVGDVAVLAAEVEDVVERDGCRETFVLRLTQTWVKDLSGWLCLSGHAGPRLNG